MTDQNRDTNDQHATETPDEAPVRRPEDLPPAARRALKEAEARRKAADDAKADREKEVGGRGGADPARYGDWEVKGIAVDF